MVGQPDSELRLPLTKKPYREPRLWVYGDIGTITRANPVVGGTADGNNKGSVHKTA